MSTIVKLPTRLSEMEKLGINIMKGYHDGLPLMKRIDALNALIKALEKKEAIFVAELAKEEKKDDK